MIGRKVQRFEVVIIRLNLRPFLDRVAEIAEDANDLVHRLDDGMFRADGTTNTGEGDVKTLGGEFAGGSPALNASKRRLNHLLNFGLEFVDALPYLALVCSQRGFSPKIIELGEDTVLARHPTITESLPVILGTDRCRLLIECRQKLAHGAIKRRGREVAKFGNGVRH